MLNAHNKKSKAFLGNIKVKKAYIGSSRVYSAGNIVTYYIDTGVTPVTEEVDSDASCLSPTTFTPTKSGWTFIGWREDTTASSSVLSSKIMDDEPITLYAVYKQDVTVSYVSGWNDVQGTIPGTRYYNAYGNTVNASVTAPAGSVMSGWVWRGWSTSNAAKADVIYSNGTTINNITGDMWLYGLYTQTITCTFYSNNQTTPATGSRYYNSSGNIANASVTVPAGATMSGWTWRGYGAAGVTTGNASVAYANGATISGLTTGYSYYGLYQQTITLSYNGNGATSGSTASQEGTRYYNSYGTYKDSSFTLRSNGFTRNGYTFNGWDLGAVGESITLSANATATAKWTDNAWTWVSNYVGSGDTLQITITEAKNAQSLDTGDKLSRFDIHSYHDDDLENMSIDFQTNRVSTKGCKYMTLTFPDFFMGRNTDGVIRDYVRVMSTSSSTPLKEWTDRVYGGSQKIDVSSASQVYIIGCIGAWGQSQSPSARVQAISFSN